MINALRSSPPDLRDDLMTSIIYSANARVVDPVRGCLGEIQTLLSKTTHALTELHLNTQHRANNDVPLFSYEYVFDEAVFVENPDQQFQNQHFENQQYMPSFHQSHHGNNQYKFFFLFVSLVIGLA
ncbi:LOB domain-containing protein 3-like [Amaranthus tricolor]|uniref:LOB domain-containing protein 3-like n=1 Tax=Amaranthus tricolor TaxID=29722 RepID=UPI002583A710|nr:LOB domain-containing protein 3-like [Amaranthus tricolor]